MPFPPYPSIPAPATWAKGQLLTAPGLRSDVLNALLLFTQPPVFSGSQTGAPAHFTVNGTTNIFTAAGTAYQLNQPVVFSTGGGGFPSGLTAGTVYYVFAPAGDQFGISLTAGGAQYTGVGGGVGTVADTQVITPNAWTAISLDTEPGAGDPWAGHQTTSSPAYYYAMFPGYYLAEFSFPSTFNASGGVVSAGLLTQEGGGLPATVGGGCGNLSTTSTAGHNATPTVTKLLAFSVTGSYGAAGNNYVAAAAWTDTGTSPFASPTRVAQMNVEWLAALSGNPLLPIPDNDTWPAPPIPAGATFLNKNVRDTIGFLAYRPVFEAYLSASATLPSAASLPPAGHQVTLDTAYIDNRSAFASGGWQAPVPGVYDVYAQVPVSTASTSVAAAAGLTVTSANYNSGSAFTIWGPVQAAATTGETSVATVRRRLRLNRGDLVQLAGFQNDSSAGSATVPAGTWKARMITIYRAK